jgi:hypothetical protein
MSRFLLPLLLLPAALCKDVLFGESGGIPTTSDLATAESNKALLEDLLASLSPGDSLTVENSTFIIQGGVHATGLTDVTLRIEGTLKFFDDIDSWPLMDEPDPYIANRDVQEALHFTDFQSVTLTGGGTIDGSGLAWWGFPGIGYLIRKENRPRLMVMDDCKDITIEHILFKDSAYWTTLFNNVDGLVIRHSEVSARRPWDNHDGQHNLYDLSALNTDGFDVTGRNVHIHDCKIWNQDDCIAVKDNYKGGVSENMLFERIEASGMGLVIGSSTWPPESTPAAPLTLSLLLARFARSLARSRRHSRSQYHLPGLCYEEHVQGSVRASEARAQRRARTNNLRQKRVTPRTPPAAGEVAHALGCAHARLRRTRSVAAHALGCKRPSQLILSARFARSLAAT